MNNSKLLISGNTTLTGTVNNSGAKNAALPELAAAILTSGQCSLTNVPRVNDVKVMLETFLHLGADGEFTSNTLHIRFKTLKDFYIDAELAQKTRASILLLGPILARFGQVHIAMPGGCSIGERKINFHLEGLNKMGADISQKNGYISASAKRLQAINYRFPFKTVTGTENLIMAASLAKGNTVLSNCALEPEIDDLIKLLNKMGAQIVRTLDTVKINGVENLSGTSHQVIPDRIEAGTFMIAGALSNNHIKIKNCIPEHNKFLIKKLSEMGAFVKVNDNQVDVHSKGPLKPINLATNPYPAFPTDLQAQMTTLMTQVNGSSTIKENIFDNRFQHVKELNKMGANIICSGNKAVISGLTPLNGCELLASDLRASAALLLAATIAKETTTINNAAQLFRGYEDIAPKLNQLGAKIQIRESDK